MLGDRLIVGVSTDEFNRSKGKSAFTPFVERVEILQACRWVDVVIPETSWDQKRSDVVAHNVSTFVIGSDWTGAFDDLMDICQVQYLSRTPEISTTQIKILLAEPSLTLSEPFLDLANSPQMLSSLEHASV